MVNNFIKWNIFTPEIFKQLKLGMKMSIQECGCACHQGGLCIGCPCSRMRLAPEFSAVPQKSDNQVLLERIEKLEKYNEREQFDSETALKIFQKRIEKLESIISNTATHKAHCELEQRLTELTNEFYELSHKVIRVKSPVFSNTLERISKIEKENFNSQLDGLEDKIVTELDILRGFNEETQKGFNRLSERIEKMEKRKEYSCPHCNGKFWE